MPLAFINFRVLDFLDILAVAILLYWLYKLVRGSVAINIFLGILSIYLIWKLVEALQMELLSEILGQFIGVGVLALIIVFQQEIRSFLLLIGKNEFFKNFDISRFFNKNKEQTEALQTNLKVLSAAIKRLANEKLGAILVITKENDLRIYVSSGLSLNAELTEELIHSIFFKNSPMHDGAVIIRGNTVISAKCVLPLTEKELPSQFGLRHRAAVGITENSDALAIVVSEEKGTIGASYEGNLFENIQPEELSNRLNEWLSH